MDNELMEQLRKNVSEGPTPYVNMAGLQAEIAGGTLFMATYGTDTFVPVLKSVDIKFVKPGTTDLVADVALTEQEAAEKIAPAQERGRGDYLLDVAVTDESGEAVALFAFNYFALPAQR